MGKWFTEWTVLPHEPVVKAEDNLWFAQGTLPRGETRRVMVVARYRDGRLLIHNAIALEEPLMAELEAFGDPAVLVVPNAFHRQDAKIWKDRYPKLHVVCPKAARKAVGKAVPVDGDYAEAPADDTVRLVHFDGCKGREGVLAVTSGDKVTLVVNDMLMNYRKQIGGVMGFFIAPTGTLAVPRFARWFFVSDKQAFRVQLEALATPAVGRLIVSHGDVIEQDVAAKLRAAAAAI